MTHFNCSDPQSVVVGTTTYIPNYQPQRLGWVCPGCNTVYSPDVNSCYCKQIENPYNPLPYSEPLPYCEPYRWEPYTISKFSLDTAGFKEIK